MLVPIDWLKEYVDIELSTADLAHRLTASGSSVERIIQVGQNLDDLIVGLVEEVNPHPNADRLRLAKVNIGPEIVEVVCGATNLKAGQHIVYAKEGAHIPINMHDDHRQPFTLKKATIRGVESNGMICSVAEMGLGEDHEGILVLPESTKVGQKITTALNYPQTVFDIEITTNRSDELSLLGIAREVSALTEKQLNLPTTKQALSVNKTGTFKPLIQSPNCFRLITQQLKVTVGPSPWWMQQRLTLAGMRPINNIVDITNYVMLEYGQPLHAYDVAQLAGHQLIARQAQPGEKLTTLDGINRQLTSEMLVIADEQQALGIAGIMGGSASKTTNQTTEIVLEAAAFDPIGIRKTANTLALRSEASRRFERSVDREMTAMALARAVDLMITHADAQVLSKAIDSYPAPFESKQLTLHAGKLNQYLGQPVDPAKARSILKSLGFGDASAFGNDTEWEIAVRVPSWRAHDIQEEVDLIEEVVRMVGYDQLPVSLPTGELSAQPINPEYTQRHQLRNALARAGWSEIISVSLVGQNWLDQLQVPLPSIQLANPLSSEWTHLRSSLLPGLIKSATNNIRWQHHLKLFELGVTYQPNKQALPHQDMHLGLLLCSPKTPEFALAEIKGVVEYSLRQAGGNPDAIVYNETVSVNPPFDANQSAAIVVNGHTVGEIGLLPEPIRESLHLPPSTFIAELTVEEIVTKSQPYQLQPLTMLPGLEEDLSVVVSEKTSVAKVLAIISQSGQPLLESVELSQVYRSPKLGQNLKSLTFHLTYRDPSKTLSSKEVGRARHKIAEQLKKEDMHVRE